MPTGRAKKQSQLDQATAALLAKFNSFNREAEEEKYDIWATFSAYVMAMTKDILPAVCDDFET